MTVSCKKPWKLLIDIDMKKGELCKKLVLVLPISQKWAITVMLQLKLLKKYVKH